MVRLIGWDVDVFARGELDGSCRVVLEHETDPTRVDAQTTPDERSDAVRREKSGGYGRVAELRCGARQLEAGGHRSW